MSVLEAESWELELEEKLKCPILFSPSLVRIKLSYGQFPSALT